jgi:hypothetical protein
MLAPIPHLLPSVFHGQLTVGEWGLAPKIMCTLDIRPMTCIARSGVIANRGYIAKILFCRDKMSVIISPYPRRGGGFNSEPNYFAGIFKRSMGARNRVGIGLSYWPARGYKAGGIDSLESIFGLLKSLKIRALYSVHASARTAVLKGGEGKGPF